MPHWIIHKDGGPRRVNHAAAVVGNMIFSFGGYCTGGDYKNRRPIDVFIFNTDTLEWRTLPLNDIMQASAKAKEDRGPDAMEVKGQKHDRFDLPFLRYGHSAVEYEGKIYLWGGRNDVQGACSKLFSFDTKTLAWTLERPSGDVPHGRDGHSACVINKHMYIFGGFEDETQCYSNATYALNLETLHWEFVRTKNDPHWRDFHTATAVGHLMFVFGGRSDESGPWYTNHEFYCNRLQILDTQTKTWTMPTTSQYLPVGRRSHSAFLYKEHLYIFGGYNQLLETHFNDMYKLNTRTLEWTQVLTLGQKPRRRRRQCCILLNEQVFFFGGTSPKRRQIDDGTVDENLMDLADLHVLDFTPTLKTLCKLCVIENKLDIECLPSILRWEIQAMTADANISKPLEMPQG